MNVIEKLNSIKNGEMTAKENVEGFIKVIDENNEEINAFIEKLLMKKSPTAKMSALWLVWYSV